ncbi:MAG: molybdopterin-dependent oxidoreductase [Rhodopseudomonas palustris]|nr:molybdopterin-dependent oxidoreductase [Rhodopseudomonas palustris]
MNSKILLVAARTLGVGQPRACAWRAPAPRRVANTSPTAASTGADLNGKAVELACLEIRSAPAARSRPTSWRCDRRRGLESASGERFATTGRRPDLTWEELVQAAYMARVDLSAQAHYATPGIHFDRAREKGAPFAYHVFGTALVEATVDVPARHLPLSTPCALVHDAGSEPRPAGRPRPGRGGDRPGHRLDDAGGAGLFRRRAAADRHPVHLQGARHPHRARRASTSASCRTPPTPPPCSTPRPSASRRSCTASAPTSPCSPPCAPLRPGRPCHSPRR